MKVVKYVVDVVRVREDFYAGVEEITWVRKKDTFETREDAIVKARKCRNAWTVVEITVDTDTMKVKEKIVADQLHN